MRDKYDWLLRGYLIAACIAAPLLLYAAYRRVDSLTFVLALVAFVLLIPPRFDPAIRLKEWVLRKRR